MNKNTKVVCLGGGIGTVNLIRGLKKYTRDISVVASVADEGGSAGRLRRLYNIFPPGDVMSCMAALSDDPIISKLLAYRFPGDRYAEDGDLQGHRVGNLIVAALQQIEGDFQKAIDDVLKLFNIKGNIYPATNEKVSISAKTIEGVMAEGEEAIDLGKYEGERILDYVYLHPKEATAPKVVLNAIEQADMVVAGPGDLYTTILPVLIVKDIKEALEKTKAKKIFVVNVTNKPFETKDYKLSDFINAISKHMGGFPFDFVIANNNHSVKIPDEYDYSFVDESQDSKEKTKIVRKDIIDESFPLYHSSEKLAKAVFETV